MLYLCDNQGLLKDVKKGVGEGKKTTLVGAPDAKFSREAIEEHRKRRTAGAVTFLVEVEAHRGERANEKSTSRLPVWWVTADRWLRAISTPSSKSLTYKKEKKTSSSQIKWHRYVKRTTG